MHVYCKVSDDVPITRCPYRSRTPPLVLPLPPKPESRDRAAPHPRPESRVPTGRRTRRALSHSELASGFVRKARWGREQASSPTPPAVRPASRECRREGFLGPGFGRASIPSSMSPSLLYLLSHRPRRLPRHTPLRVPVPVPVPVHSSLVDNAVPTPRAPCPAAICPSAPGCPAATLGLGIVHPPFGCGSAPQRPTSRVDAQRGGHGGERETDGGKEGRKEEGRDDPEAGKEERKRGREEESKEARKQGCCCSWRRWHERRSSPSS